MRTFRIDDKDTMADVGAEITADSLEELLIAGAESLYAIMLEDVAFFDESDLEISLESPDREQLLVDWLSELLYLFDTEGIIVNTYSLNLRRGSFGYRLKAALTGRKYKPGIDISAHEIKAVTYYKLRVTETRGQFSCHVVFDL